MSRTVELGGMPARREAGGTSDGRFWQNHCELSRPLRGRGLRPLESTDIETPTPSDLE